jgi:hypothetical protein
LLQDSSGPSAQKLIAQQAIPGFACYRTVEETYATMDQLAARRPSLAQVIDIGTQLDRAEDGRDAGLSHARAAAEQRRHRFLAAEQTEHGRPQRHPRARVHDGRTDHALRRVAGEQLWRRLGSDVAADSFRFHFILQANPDGRKKAESGLSWRKNVDNDNGSCSANAYGVDLNRNFPWRFGTVSGGSSGNACDSTYRGPGRNRKRKCRTRCAISSARRAAVASTAAACCPIDAPMQARRPSDYRGMFLDIHSYNQMVLWPWATTSAAAPNMGQLRTLGRRMAYFNNYSPRQWIGMYAADGTNTDTVYGITGAPSYTVELGQAFFEDCNTFETSTYPKNLAMLKYTARSLSYPYIYPGGPETTSIAISSNTVQQGYNLGVSGWVDDSHYNQGNGTEPVQLIVNARAFVDVLPGRPAHRPTR